MAQLVSREELALVLDESISEERFNALYNTARRIVQSAWTGDDVDTLTGRTGDVVASVLMSVMARIVSNPKGARTLQGGPAAVTFGGADGEITRVFALNEDERAALDSVSARVTTGGAFTIRPYGS